MQEVAEMETALVLVAAGLGVGIFPEGVSRRSQSNLKIKSLPSEKVRSEIGVAVLTTRTTPLVERFVALSKQIGLR